MSKRKRIIMLCVGIFCSSLCLLGIDYHALFHPKEAARQKAEKALTSKLGVCDVAVKIYNDIQKHPGNWVVMDAYEYEHLGDTIISNLATTLKDSAKINLLAMCEPGGFEMNHGVKYLVNAKHNIVAELDWYGIGEPDDGITNNHGHLIKPTDLDLNAEEIKLLSFPVNDRMDGVKQVEEMRAAKRRRQDSIQYAIECAAANHRKDSISQNILTCQQ